MGSFKKYVHWKLLIFDLLPPCSSLFILHAGYFWNFEWKITEWKERKELFFCKLNVKDDNVFYTDIYTITTCIKKVLKNAYVFLIKRLATTKHLLEGTLFAVWKIRQFFSQSEHRDRLDLSPPSVCFHLLFKDLLLYFLNQAESFTSESYFFQLHGNANKETRKWRYFI